MGERGYSNDEAAQAQNRGSETYAQLADAQAKPDAAANITTVPTEEERADQVMGQLETEVRVDKELGIARELLEKFRTNPDMRDQSLGGGYGEDLGSTAFRDALYHELGITEARNKAQEMPNYTMTRTRLGGGQITAHGTAYEMVSPLGKVVELWSEPAHGRKIYTVSIERTPEK